jgi:hypothetical protein
MTTTWRFDPGSTIGFVALGKNGPLRLAGSAKLFAAACRGGGEWDRVGLYMSAYTYPAAEFAAHFARQSRAGWRGPCGAHLVRFDCDAKGDQARALADSRRLFSHLVDHFGLTEDDVLVGPSGGKGYHAEVVVGPIPPGDRVVPAMRRFCRNISGTLDLTTSDDSVYDATRFWSVWNSRHEKTGLYKRRFTVDELFRLNPEAHAGLAVGPRPFDPPGPIRSGQFDADWAAAVDAEAGTFASSGGGGEMAGIPSARHVHGPMTDLAWDFLRGKVPEGGRHNALVHAAAVFAGAGCPKGFAFDLLTRAADACGMVADYDSRDVLRTAENGWQRGSAELQQRIKESESHEDFD